MDYKTILVRVDAAPETLDRVAFAARLANAQGAHLVGMAQTGIARFDTLAQQAGVASFSHRIDDDEPGLALAQRALYADLVVAGRTVLRRLSIPVLLAH